jgi:hypothetical protein
VARPGLNEAVCAAALAHHHALFSLGVGRPEHAELAGCTDSELSYLITQNPALPLGDRQQLLECADDTTRLLRARALLRRETILMQSSGTVPVSAASFRGGRSVT